MKKFTKRFLALFLSAALAVVMLPATLTDSDTVEAASVESAADTDSENSDGGSEDTSDAQEESSTIVYTATVDEDGNVIAESTTESTSEDGETTLSTEEDDTETESSESSSGSEETSSVSYTITFDANNASASGTVEDLTVTDSESQTLPSDGYTVSGYSLVSWNTKADGTGTSFTPGDSVSASDLSGVAGGDNTVTLYAQWSEDTYTVVFVKNKSDAEGTQQSVTFSVANGGTLLKSSAYTHDYYKISSWNTKADGSGTSYKTGAKITTALASKGKTIKLYAQWKEQSYTTTTTYKLTLTATTTAASSSNSALKKVSVSVPKMKVTTKKTYESGATKSSSKTTSYGLTVKVHVRNVGWKTASKNSAGTSYTYTASKASSGSYIQAVRITPSSKLKSVMSKAKVTFIYRAKTKYFGTLGWAKAGYTAGSTGCSNPMTGLTLKVISTSKASSYSTKYRYISSTSVQYKTKYSGSSSWLSAKKNGSTSGKASSGSSIGSLAAKLSKSSFSVSGGIKYSVRTSSKDSSSNWSSWKSNYSTSGSKNSKLRAIKIQLTGDMADYYDVYYRVYVSGYGWLGWAKNGQKAGTGGAAYNISAVQVKLVAKGSGAPGSTGSHYITTSSSTKLKMIVRAQQYSSSTKYLILVDRSAKKVGIFTGKKGNWTLKYYWSCCVGKASTPTISGSYTSGIKVYSFGESKGYSCYYATQISGNYLFHSVLYYPYTRTIKDGTMGKAVSHGCVRLTISHAKWIYDNIPTNTKINIY